jgi:superfamily II DNA or RNA helicase
MKLWREAPHHMIVPRYFIPEDRRGTYEFPFVDLRPQDFPRVEIRHRVTPRDDSQAQAIDTLTQTQAGILNLACGKGKTTVALAAIANNGVPAIVVVNNQGLMVQWETLIRKHWMYTGPVGIVQQNKFDWKHPITLAMIQTLASKSDEWPADFRRHFGIAVFDEVHHLSAPTFVKTADMFFGKRWGLTATPKRADGLEVVYFYHLGRVVYSDLEQQLIPDIWFFHTKVKPATPYEAKEIFCDRSGQENISLIRKWLGLHQARNEIILEEIQKASSIGRKILAITHSRGHAEILHQKLPGSGLCIGKMKAEKRLQMLQECDVTFATVQVAGEALDAPRLDTLFVLTPGGDHNATQQWLGRIQRALPGKKKALAVIFEDDIGFCRGLCGKMRKYLRDQGYPFQKIGRQP